MDGGRSVVGKGGLLVVAFVAGRLAMKGLVTLVASVLSEFDVDVTN